jgi:hypothetical protein
VPGSRLRAWDWLVTSEARTPTHRFMPARARDVLQLNGAEGTARRFTHMPMSGRYVPVYLCADLHVANGRDRQFSLVIHIVGGPNA